MIASNIKLNNRKIRIGIVGCGKITTNHFNAIKESSQDFELVALCDTHPENLSKGLSQWNVPGFDDIDAMLQSTSELDIVTLCSPSGLHAKQAIKIASHGKHVITEKPMATRWTDGIEMINACDKSCVKLFVVKQVRYQPVFQLLKNTINKGRFGRIYLVNLNVFWTRPQSYYDQAPWRGTWEFDGGAFMNQASHYVDMLVWLVGPIECVQSMMGTLAINNIETEDTGTLNLRWRSGALGSMNVTMLTYPKNFETSLTIIGEKGTVKISGPSANKIEHWEFSTSDPNDSMAEKLNISDDRPSHSNHLLYYQNVAKSLRGEESIVTDGREGLRSLEVLTAAYLSARDNRTVNLPLRY